MAATASDLQPYASLNDEDCEKRVNRAREIRGDRVVTPGQHFQRDEIFKDADFSGDSLKLSRQAAYSKAEYICTSTNAQGTLDCSFERRQKVRFFPNQHLGRNSGYKLGIPLEEMVIWDFDLPLGDLSKAQIKNAKTILWKGFCSVHQMFKPQQVENFRREYPDGFVISHAEASFEVCQMSDYVGSTEYIIKTITDADPGTQWLVGTELNLVNLPHQTLASGNKTVQFMPPMVCMCSAMFRIHPQHLAWVLGNLLEGKVVKQISVPVGGGESRSHRFAAHA